MEVDEIKLIHDEGRMLTLEEAKKALEEQYNIDFNTGDEK